MRKFMPLAYLFLILLQNGCGLLAAALAPSAVATSTATSFGASEAYHTARGGTYKILIVEPIHDLRSYRHVDLSPFRSEIGDNILPELLKTVNERVSQKISKSEFGKPGEPILIIEGEVIDIDQGTLSNSILLKVRLLDKQTGQSLGVANVDGKEEGFLKMDGAVSGLADGIVELLKKHRE